MEQKGVLFIVCGPSGVGKSTLCDRLLDEFERIQFSVSYTTRAPREGEIDGEDYHFVDDETFDEMVESNRFAEWAKVHGNKYGTSFDVIESAWDDDRDLLFDIDYQGARQLKESYPDSTGVFIIPPDMRALEDRLRGRDKDSKAVIERRIHNAREELAQYELFEFIVENDELERAYDVLSSIYVAARHRRHLQADRIERLLAPSRRTRDRHSGGDQ